MNLYLYYSVNKVIYFYAFLDHNALHLCSFGRQQSDSYVGSAWVTLKKKQQTSMVCLVSAYSELQGLILSSSPFYRFRRVGKLHKVTPLTNDEIMFKPRHLTSEYLLLTVIYVDSLETPLALRRKLMVYDNDKL